MDGRKLTKGRCTLRGCSARRGTICLCNAIRRRLEDRAEAGAEADIASIDEVGLDRDGLSTTFFVGRH